MKQSTPLVFASCTLVACVAFVACGRIDDGKPTTITPPPDAAGTSSNALKENAEDCTEDKQCLSGHCFIGGKASWCAPPCNNDNVATVCVPAPPFDGTCNKQGYCRRP